MKSPRYSLLVLLIVVFSPLAGCAGGASGGNAVPPGPLQPSKSGPGGGSASVTLASLHFDLYFESYSGQTTPMAGNGPLAVNSTTSSMYFYDVNYHWIRWALNQYQQLKAQTYQPMTYTTQSGTQIAGGDAYAFDASDTLYTLAHDATSEYLVAHAENTGTPVIVPLNVPASTPSQVFDMESLPDGSIAIATGASGGNQLIVADNPLSASSQVRHATLPSGCGYRVTAAINNDIYVSACGTFNQIFHYSPALSLIASAVVPNAKHINSLAPDPTNDGVWFSDDRANIYGALSAGGAVRTFRANVGPGGKIASLASLDGIVVAALYDSTTPTDVFEQILEDGTFTGAYVAPDYIGQFMNPVFVRGGNGSASCTGSQGYLLGADGNVLRITL